MSVLHTMSDDAKIKYKADKLKEIRDYNSQLIQDLGVSVFDFNMKTPFRDEQGRLVVGIFASEFRKVNGFYFELIDFDLNPSDPERKVYKISQSDSFEQEYALNSKGSYLVPLEELRIIDRNSTNAINSFLPGLTNKKELFDVRKAPAPMEDALFSEMTIRDYFAIHTGKPVSSRQWLNDLIKNK